MTDGEKVLPPAVARTEYVPARIVPVRTSAPLLPNKKYGADNSLRDATTLDPDINSMKTEP
jgi:hypothetical protein